MIQDAQLYLSASFTNLLHLASMQLHTQRLDLVPFSLQDLDLFHATNNHPFVRKHLWDDEILPVELSRDILNTVEGLFAEQRYGLWQIIERESGTFVGYTGLWTFFGEPQPQLLYALLPDYTGKGYATEAAGTVMHYAFEELKFSYLRAATDPPNEASGRVCLRLGMTFLGERNMDGKATNFYEVKQIVRNQ